MKQLILLFLFVSTSIFAQERNCGSHLRLIEHLENHPEAKKKRLKLEKLTQYFNLEKISNTTIPVVVHVIYKNAQENISDVQIESQIEVLNRDFTRTNTDAFNTPTDFLPIVANIQLNFCLAKQTPNGAPSNGIIRKQTINNFFTLSEDAIYYDSLGGSTAWDTERYLNIWVAKTESGVLGWAQFPAGGDSSTDGVVIDFEHFGTIGTVSYPYNLGRTTTHELGHWFNLFHIWGDNNCGNDWVNDTPIQEQANFGCKIHPHISCSNNGDMFMNFMDYTNDACMNSFTNGQKNRVWSSISNYRLGLLTSNGCSQASLANSDAGIIAILKPNNQTTNCANPIYPEVVLKNYNSTPLNSVVIKYTIDGDDYYQSWNGNLTHNETDTLLLSGISSTGTTHLLSVSTENPNNSIDINSNNDEHSIIFSSINGEQIELNIMTDNYASETSWMLLDENDNILDKGDSLSNNTLYQWLYCLNYNCYKFIINDSYGDGFCCNFGNGNFSITSSLENKQYAQSIPFTFSDTSYFCIGSTAINEKNQSFQIYPNPTTNNLWINYNFESYNRPIFARILNSLGQTILSVEIQKNKIDLGHLANGAYQLIIETETKKYTQKIIIQH